MSLINFVHANGIVATAYGEFFKHLASPVLAKHQYAHHPAYPLNDQWSNQVLELIHYIETHCKAPIVGMGHSFGAVLTYKAACLRPELFKAVIMCDPPLLVGWGGHLFGLAKKTRFIDKVTPAKISLARKKQWSKDVNIAQYFATKRFFKDIQDESVYQYALGITQLSAVTQPTSTNTDASAETYNHYQLTYDPSIEANTFRTIPHDVAKFYGQIKVPGLLLTGSTTDVTFPIFQRHFLKGNVKFEHVELPGGHMFVLEQPKLTAQHINDFLQRL